MQSERHLGISQWFPLCVFVPLCAHLCAFVRPCACVCALVHACALLRTVHLCAVLCELIHLVDHGCGFGWPPAISHLFALCDSLCDDSFGNLDTDPARAIPRASVRVLHLCVLVRPCAILCALVRPCAILCALVRPCARVPPLHWMKADLLEVEGEYAVRIQRCKYGQISGQISLNLFVSWL